MKPPESNVEPAPSEEPLDPAIVLSTLQAHAAEMASLRAEVLMLRAQVTAKEAPRPAGAAADYTTGRSDRLSRARLLTVGALGAAGAAVAALTRPDTAAAQSEPLLGEIALFSGNFAPVGWASCDGRLMAISQNTALFSLLGTTYGGDGKSTFALPDLRGRAPISAGQGTGLSSYSLGQAGGVEQVTLTASQMPAHNHAANCLTASGGAQEQQSPKGAVWSAESQGATTVYAAGAPDATLDPGAIGTSGSSQAHSNVQPYLAINFIIALQGVFPSRP